MTKKEVIWREILFRATEKKKIEFTQSELAQKYGFSLSTVFNALKIPRDANIVEGKRGLRVKDTEKFLQLYSTLRSPKKDIIYETNVSKSVLEIEGEMPPKIIYGAYSAFLKKYQEAPADYDRVYIYSAENYLEKIRSRFPYGKGYANLIVLRADPWLENFGKITPDCQTFADLWNLPEWYAKDFLNSLKDKILS